MTFDANDGREIVVWLIGWGFLAAMFVFALHIIKEQIGCLAQIGLFLLFLLIGALTSYYFYLVLPLFLISQAVVAFSSRNEPRE